MPVGASNRSRIKPQKLAAATKFLGEWNPPQGINPLKSSSVTVSAGAGAVAATG